MKPPQTSILIGDVRQRLEVLPARSVHCCITSPPYWGLRAYGTDPQVWGGELFCHHVWQTASVKLQSGGTGEASSKQVSNSGTQGDVQSEIESGTCEKCGAWRGELGAEPTPEMFCQHLVEVFACVWRVLRDDGTLWVNMGDCYAGSWGNYCGQNRGSGTQREIDTGTRIPNPAYDGRENVRPATSGKIAGLKPKDLCGIPWRLAFALQAAGWYLRSDIPWVKRSPMPESTDDRPSKALEYIFMLSKSPDYFFDMQAVKVAASVNSDFGRDRPLIPMPSGTADDVNDKRIYTRLGNGSVGDPTGRNFRNADLWFESIESPHGLCCLDDEIVGLDVTSESFGGAHFATFPKKLVEPFVKAGTSERGCCPDCGAPWDRITEKGKYSNADRPAARKAAGINPHIQGSAMSCVGGGNFPQTTIGWAPGCECYGVEALPDYPEKPAEEELLPAWVLHCVPIRDRRLALLESFKSLATVPCTVLDCFGGSCTTGVVAKALGRDSILIELNPEYAAMGHRRIQRGYDPPSKQEIAAGQGSLF